MENQIKISSTLEIVEELRAGRMVILVDEEDRENEGDLVMAADFITPEAVNFMAKYGRGLICLTLTQARCQQLGLRPMVVNNGTSFGTNFTVSIEAAQGVTTGISAADRAHTIRTAVARHAQAQDLVQPGHVFPLMAEPGGVLMRAGHTEAGCDLAAMAGLTHAAVICEIMKDDGTMARLPDLFEFAQVHQLKIGTIVDLIHYRAAHESLVEVVHERLMNTAHGVFRALALRDKPTGSAHFALVHGEIDPVKETLVRVHEPLSVLDFLEIVYTSHSFSVPQALQAIAQSEQGVLVMLNCNETPEQLFAEFKALDDVQSQGGRYVSAKTKMDLRTYGIGAQILRLLNVGKMRLLANPRKMPSMAGFDLQVAGYVTKENS